jgi:hypothetical protein
VLTTEQIRQRLGELRYRPNWSWSLQIDPWEGAFIRFVATDVEDSYGGKTLDIGFNTWLPPMLTVDQLDAFMQWRLARCEVHEAREFLHGPDHRPLFDPHKAEAA